jgi:uncharacterized membrane-anchored protein
MNVNFLNSCKNAKHSAALCFVAILAGSFSLQQCPAQQSSAPTVSDPLSQVNWATGPYQLHMGDFADMDLPAGYRMTDVRGARTLLESLNQPVPADLVGIIAPVSSSAKWWAVIEYDSKGYVKNPESTKLDNATVLKAVQARVQTQNSGVTSLDWQSAPAYDPQMHSLAWSLEIQAGSMKALNSTVALLNRYGVLQMTAYQSYPVTDPAPLKQLAGDINFKDGERYTDYQAGDKLADVGLAELIAGGKPAPKTAAASTGTVMILIYSGFAVCIVGVAVVLLRKKDRRHAAKVSARESSRNRSSSRPAAATVAPVSAAVAAPIVATQAPAATATSINIQQTAMPAAKTPPTMNNGTKQSHRGRRRKVFNYPKFYTTVMRELSLHAYGPGSSAKGKSNGYANGHANGHTNGQSNGYPNGANGSNGHANVPNIPAANDALKAEIVELIATQKNLINEQKCLLEQQTRLIEEKRWLIEEQTAFIRNQAGQQYP